MVKIPSSRRQRIQKTILYSFAHAFKNTVIIQRKINFQIISLEKISILFFTVFQENLISQILWLLTSHVLFGSDENEMFEEFKEDGIIYESRFEPHAEPCTIAGQLAKTSVSRSQLMIYDF